MKKNKDLWKLELIRELRKDKLNIRVLHFAEIVYSTIIPIALTYISIKTNNPALLFPILIIIFFRLRITK